MAETENDSDVRQTRKERIKQYRLFWMKEEKNAVYKKISAILQKIENDRTEEEQKFLLSCPELVRDADKRLQKRLRIKERQREFEDEPEVLKEKCETLANAIAKAKCLVVYTGAGISTSACIPDYRGPQGIWTLLQQGKDIGSHDLTLAEPTLTHMALAQLYRKMKVKHVVSQNCDGLHFRSGLPRNVLSEVHGNMYIEVCRHCNPPREYVRLFDVTEFTARYNHATHRRCYFCATPLVDTVVHFGERGTLKWPLNWEGASKAADKADTILCLGSSLKVLRRYPWLWCMDKPPKKRPSLYIVNLQWTPKDDQALLKINGKCDEVMKQVMDYLKIPIPDYNRIEDPLFKYATPLHLEELHTTTRRFLQIDPVIDTQGVSFDSKDLNNKVKSECDNNQISDSHVQAIKEEVTEKDTNMDTNKNDLAKGNSVCSDANVKQENGSESSVPEVDGKSAVKDTEFAKSVLQYDTKSDLDKDSAKSVLQYDTKSDLDKDTKLKNEHSYSKTETDISIGEKKLNAIVKDKITESTRNVCSSSTLPRKLNRDKVLSRKMLAKQPFYLRYEPKFEVVTGDSFCDCCDKTKKKKPRRGYVEESSSTENEDAKDGTDQEEAENENNSVEEDDDASDALKTPATNNPGWFGKGYRKRTKRKR